MTNNFHLNFKAAHLAYGGLQIIPEDVEILNPEGDGERRHLYLIWIFDPAKGKDAETFDDSVVGDSLCHPFGWYTDTWDLYRVGRNDEPMLRSRFVEVMEEYTDMLSRLILAVRRAVPEGIVYAFAFAPCDCLGREMPVGTSPYAIKCPGDHDE